MSKDVRTAILKASVVQLRKVGTNNFSLSYVAHMIGASKTTVYKHFPNKEEVFLALFKENLEQRLSTGRALRHCDSLTSLEKVIAYYSIGIIRRRQHTHQIGLNFLPTNIHLYKKARPELIEDVHSKLQQNHRFPRFFLDEAIECDAITVPTSLRHETLLDLLMIERGLVCNLMNFGLESYYSGLPNIYFIDKLLVPLKSINWLSLPLPSSTSVEKWVNNRIRTSGSVIGVSP
ncbi:TetR/AcrR family transcriptional regulator [Ferrimonas pelagia]|uniref:TetR/AcrR family transcriptional regulator n=1 Tax=Ferrimonas pelagia TaxID=1177826 RepID=UPI0031EE6A5C